MFLHLVSLYSDGESNGKVADVAPALVAGDTVAAANATTRSEAAVRNRLRGGSVFRTGLGHGVDSLDEDDDDSDLHAPGGVAPANEHPDAFANAMRFSLRVGQALSVLPVDAMTGSWSRLRAAYAIAINVGLSMLAILSTVLQLTRPKRPSLVDFSTSLLAHKPQENFSKP